MARHIMAVCVVCLLCADHFPCQEHFNGIVPEVSASIVEDKPNKFVYESLNARVFQRTDLLQNPSISTNNNNNNGNIHVSQEEQRNPYIDREYRRQNLDADNRRLVHHRSKRHVGHEESRVLRTRPEITEDFLKRIFEEYGDSDGSTIHISEFQRMLKQLGLQQLLEQRLSNENSNDSCISDSTLVHHIRPHDLSHQEHISEHANCKTNNTGDCHDDSHNHHDHHHLPTNYTLVEEDLVNLCPVLLYQLASPSALERSGCIQNSVLSAIDNIEEKLFKAGKEDIIYVWIYAFISVFACGILGLVGVAIIPFMDSRYYKHIIQFLVSLAVGTMTGDALLHLLPHSLAGQSESNMIFKGLTCMSGIIFFYITEHGLTMISEWRKRIAKKETKKPSRAKVVRDPDSSINNSVAGDKLCKSKYSSYPYCYDEIAMDTKNDVWMHLPNNTGDGNDTSGSHAINNIEKRHNGKDSINANDANDTAQSLLSTSHNNYAPISEMNHHHHIHHNHQIPDSNTLSTNLDDQSMADGTSAGNVNENGSKDKSLINNDTVTVILREHESSHHGHSHKHGHVHSPPESLSAVAWMIIMGDGLHNFTDGMAIGAAFAENIAGGFSTSLAVFCHELPHELGDFAILMKAGMSVKSAVYYNLLTGVLSFIGMIFGIVFGQSPETAQWMFAAAAGLFIYIALVDMMPELSAAHKSLEQFALQILGMSSGVLIMLLIAIYEGDLMTLFSSSPTATSPIGHNHIH